MSKTQSSPFYFQAERMVEEIIDEMIGWVFQ